MKGKTWEFKMWYKETDVLKNKIYIGTHMQVYTCIFGYEYVRVAQALFSKILKIIQREVVKYCIEIFVKHIVKKIC